MTTITDVKTRLAEIGQYVYGIKRAYAHAPQSLPPGDLPVLVVMTGGATMEQIGDTMVRETRQYLLRLYVTPIQAGYDGEAERRTEQYLPIIRDVYLRHPLLGNGTRDATLPTIVRAAWDGDNGVMVMPYAGDNYLGAEFKVVVTSLVPVEIAKYD